MPDAGERDWPDLNRDVRYLLNCTLCGHQFVGRRRRKLCQLCVHWKKAMKTEDERMGDALAMLTQTFGEKAQMVLIKLSETSTAGVLDLRIAHHNVDCAQSVSIMSQAVNMLRVSTDLTGQTVH